METEVKVAVLEQKLEDLNSVVLRIDTAIQKLSEVNTTVSRMLAVHEERISKQEETDSVLFTKIDKLRDKMDCDHNMVTSRIQLLERKLWTAITILGLILISTNPNSIKFIKPLISTSSGVILGSVASLVNGSN